MNREPELTEIGSRLGSEAAEHIAQRAEDYCECERQRIELSNQAKINALHVEGSRLIKLERQIEDRLRHAPPAGDSRGRRRKAYFYWFTGIVLAIAAFFFSLIAFAPYRLGWFGDLYCLGVALVTPFSIEVFLDAWKSERLFKAIVTLVFIAALFGGTLLAAIRGDLLSQQVHEMAPAIVIEDEVPPTPPPQTSFYDSTHDSLRILMLLLALAIDLGAGVAIHRALLLGGSSREDFEKLSRELANIQERLAEIVFEITALDHAPGIFVARFWRDFYRSMLTQTVRQAATKLLGLALCLLFFGGGRAFGQQRLNLVIAVDLTASETVKDHDGQSQFGKNIQGVTRLLASAPANSKIAIIGITEDSFTRPYILLSAAVSDDQGYFGERLARARQQLIRAWQRRAAQLRPNARGSDVLGALLVASALFQEVPARQRKILVLYSDMRHVTPALNLESPAHISVALATVENVRLLTNLSGVEVFVLGADAAGANVSQWESLKQFWTTYFKKAGATLSGYSILCEVPRLEP
jgi:MFS family permease